MDAGDWISGAALLVSIAAIVYAHIVGTEQRRLTRLQADREENDAIRARVADLSGQFVKVGRADWKFVIANRGAAAATQIALVPEAGAELLMRGDLERRFPYPNLEPGDEIRLTSPVSHGSALRLVARLSWRDALGAHEKTITADVF